MTRRRLYWKLWLSVNDWLARRNYPVKSLWDHSLPWFARTWSCGWRIDILWQYVVQGREHLSSYVNGASFYCYVHSYHPNLQLFGSISYNSKNKMSDIFVLPLHTHTSYSATYAISVFLRMSQRAVRSVGIHTAKTIPPFRSQIFWVATTSFVGNVLDYGFTTTTLVPSVELSCTRGRLQQIPWR
jgi:hypothetical protein